MYRRSHFIALGLLVVLVVAILHLPEKTAAQFKLAISSIFLPMFGLSSSAERMAEKAGGAVMPRADLLRELEQLKKENLQLRVEWMQTQEVWRENVRLRQALGWQPQSPWKVKLARVVGRDPAYWWRVIQIDVGTRDGIRANLPIVTTDGLAGRISEVGESRSTVVLLGDPKCRVSALIPEARDCGVISPVAASAIPGPYVELGFLTRSGEIRPGQKVFSSGLGGIFPKGIVIGQIADTHSVDGLYMEARVKLAANLNALEEVWVVLP